MTIRGTDSAIRPTDVEGSTGHCLVVHAQEQRSLLSEGGAQTDYQGFVNLAMVLLSANLLRMALENVRKYGVLLASPGAPLITVLGQAMILSALGYMVCLPCFWLRRHPVFGLCYSGVACLMWPSILCRYYLWERPVACSVFLTYGVAMGLKMASFLLCCRERLANGNGKITMPGFGQFRYFMVAPTLCYQDAYPRSAKVDIKFVLRRLLGLMSAGAMIWVLYGQYMEPTMRNSLAAFTDRSYNILAERVLKLSMSGVLLWLLVFYAFFHCYLNIVGELTRFADRRFYADWWNARSLEEYWRLWNVPAHLWLKRHVYGPVDTRCRGNRTLSMGCVFVLSALLHEYVVAVPTGVYRGWGFLAIAIQLPLIALFRTVGTGLRGTVMNVVFWILYCVVGQPLVLLLYYCEWQLRRMSG